MHVVPKPDHHYRRTDTKQLVGAEGFDADPCDLDVIRALDCGDLAPSEPAPAKKKAAAKKPPTEPPVPPVGQPED